jgi:TolB-like protein/lipoprotein NlpI
MGAESTHHLGTRAGAVFLSYASQDAAAAQRICEALRAAGIEVWFDLSDLRGGDVWDHKIRRQIHDCALFVPIISANTATRHEGYFRLEWDLADQRTHMMARDRAFIVPVCLDATPGAGTDVPESFHRVQWTRLPAGEASAAFAERVRLLLSPAQDHAPPVHPAAPGVSDATLALRSVRRPSWSKRALWVTVAVLGVLAYLVADRFWIARHGGPPTTPPAAPATAAPTAFTPPPHSIEVLPFVNMSGDKEQEYFSDGLTEELLNSLSRINELQVAARTSSFSFQGEHPDIATVAHKLNVAAVLEGSVRRSARTVRITAQLVNGSTGYHLWSQTYDRDLGDVLALQTEIATAVASALKATLLGDAATKIELGGTRNPAAFDAYLRGRKAYLAARRDKDFQTAIAKYTAAIELDPNYALAFANRSMALTNYANLTSGLLAIRESYEKAQSDAQKAIALAPDLSEGHMALAYYFENGALDFTRANEEYERALALAPGDARVLQLYGDFAVYMSRTDAGIAAGRRAVVLDPLDIGSHFHLGLSLFAARQNREAIAAFTDALALDPEDPQSNASLGLAYYGLGDFERARASCERMPEDPFNQQCLAVTYDKLGRHADAEAMLAKCMGSQGDASAYQYADIYAQWGNTGKALEWLDTAMRLRDPGLLNLKTDPLIDPLRKEPRFQAMMRVLKFPD